MEYHCTFCHKPYSSGYAQRSHQGLCKSNPNRRISSFSISRPGWNKGKTKDTDLRVKAQSESLAKNKYKRTFSEEGLMALSEAAKKNGLGGYRPHPNKGTLYKDIWFDSKWEVTVAKSLDENVVEWTRPKTGFIWTDEGRKYYPDFYLPTFDVFLDPKNPYLQVKDAVKTQEAQRRNGIRVLLLNESQLSWEVICTLI